MRELEKVKQIIYQATGLDLGYAYDDLVFSEHGIFILKFDDNNPKHLNCYFNHECDEDEKLSMFEKLNNEADQKGFALTFHGSFSMQEKPATEEIEIKFN